MTKKVDMVIKHLLATVVAATMEGINREGALSSSTVSMNKMTVVVFSATVLVVVLVLYWYYRRAEEPPR
jgi:Na+/H+-dicarboxylate symporter